MSPKIVDVRTMSYDELRQEMENLAAAWRRDPALSAMDSAGIRYGELTREIRERFNEICEISGTNDSCTNFRVYCTPADFES